MIPERESRSKKGKFPLVPLIMILLSLIVIAPSFVWLTITVHPYFTELHPKRGNLTTAELLADQVSRYINPLTSPYTADMIYPPREAPLGPLPGDLSSKLPVPYHRFARLYRGFEIDGKVTANLDLGPLAEPFAQWLHDHIARTGHGHTRLEAGTDILFVRAQVIRDTVGFSGVVIDLDSLKASLDELTDLAVHHSIFEDYLTGVLPVPEPGSQIVSHGFCLEISLDGEVIHRRGVKDLRHCEIYTTRPIPFLEDRGAITVFTPLNAEMLIARGTKRVRTASLYAGVILLVGLVLLLRRR